MADFAPDILPAETWIQIFELLKSTQWTTRQKHLKDLRLVCKWWRDVIDDNIESNARINDNRAKESCQSKFRLVKKCVIDNLTLPLDSQKCLLREPNLLEKLSFSGRITRENFKIIIRQFPNVTNLDVTFRFNREELFNPLTNEEEADFARFFGKLERLRVDCLTLKHHEEGAFYSLLGGKDFRKIMSTNMPNLKTLELYSYDFNLEDSNILSFLAYHTPQLRTLYIGCMYQYDDPTDEMKTLVDSQQLKTFSQQISIELRFSKRKVRDGTTDIETRTYLPLIQRQRSLERLVIWKACCIYISELEDIITWNNASLTCIEGKFQLSSPHLLDLGMFRQMKKLAKLNLSFDYGVSPKISNLSMLPPSTEILMVRNFSCEKDEVGRALRSLKNLKYFHCNDHEWVNKLDEEGRTNLQRNFGLYWSSSPELYVINN